MADTDYTAPSRTSRKSRHQFRSIGDTARPLAKRLIICAYCNGHLSKQHTQELFRKLDLGGC